MDQPTLAGQLRRLAAMPVIGAAVTGASSAAGDGTDATARVTTLLAELRTLVGVHDAPPGDVSAEAKRAQEQIDDTLAAVDNIVQTARLDDRWDAPFAVDECTEPGVITLSAVAGGGDPLVLLVSGEASMIFAFDAATTVDTMADKLAVNGAKLSIAVTVEDFCSGRMVAVRGTKDNCQLHIRQLSGSQAPIIHAGDARSESGLGTDRCPGPGFEAATASCKPGIAGDVNCDGLVDVPVAPCGTYGEVFIDPGRTEAFEEAVAFRIRGVSGSVELSVADGTAPNSFVNHVNIATTLTGVTASIASFGPRALVRLRSTVPGKYQFANVKQLTGQGPLVLSQPGASAQFNATGSGAAGLVGDLDCNGHVNGADLALLLSLWGTSESLADLQSNNIVDAADLAKLIANWTEDGTPCWGPWQCP